MGLRHCEALGMQGFEHHHPTLPIVILGQNLSNVVKSQVLGCCSADVTNNAACIVLMTNGFFLSGGIQQLLRLFNSNLDL